MKEKTTIEEIIRIDRTNILKYHIYWGADERRLTNSTNIILRINDESFEENTCETEHRNDSDFELCITGQEMNQILTETESQIENPEINEYIIRINKYIKSKENSSVVKRIPKGISSLMMFDLITACIGTYAGFFSIFLGLDIMKDALAFPLLLIFSAPAFIFLFVIGVVIIGTIYNKLIVNNHEYPDTYRVIYFISTLCIFGLGIAGHFAWLSDKTGIR